MNMKGNSIDKQDIKVANKFKAFHINYVVNEYKVMNQLCKEFEITRLRFRILAVIFDLIDTRYDMATRYYLPSYAEIRDAVYFVKPVHMEIHLRMLYKGGFIKYVKRKGEQPKCGRSFIGRYYDFDKRGSRVCARYSELMMKYYKPNYYTEKFDRDLEKINLKKIAEEGETPEEIKAPPPPDQDKPVNPYDLFET